MNLWNLRGYRVGGAIHIIVNNQIGFTTEPQEGRSTHFASDLAKGFEMPIIHVNADDPDACLTATRLAKGFRDAFHKDVMIDLVGYRRWGHNEGDEPAFTQPQMYEVIRSHPTAREVYARLLLREGLIGPDEADTMRREAFAALEQAKREAEKLHSEYPPDEPPETEADYHSEATPPPLSAEQLVEFNQALLDWPEGFSPNPKLGRLLQRRANTLTEGGIDWGQAEALAFASLLAEGTPIRLTGQDAERGTFSHRHAVLHDYRSGAKYTPLQNLPQAKASFAIYNSPISEAAVLGFEYGYSVRSDETLVLWEAQFGDFANVAQVIIDQFISSGGAKWKQESGLVLLLPHGYEGQGPEHSSARIERYLALSAGENWQIANCSTSAQYFHLLRQQAFELTRDPRPLVIFTPKSLLRHPMASATLQDLTQSGFQPVIDDAAALSHAQDIRRVVLCTGKVSIDLLSHSSRAQSEEVAVVRVEMLYPFPGQELTKVFANYPNLREVVWVQEEPRNMGAWRYMSPRLAEIAKGLELKVIARPERSSPATGFLERYQAEQEQIIAGALRSPVKELGGTHGS
jgi:2-oxoglutarate dehydrogenase E1 component